MPLTQHKLRSRSALRVLAAAALIAAIALTTNCGHDVLDNERSPLATSAVAPPAPKVIIFMIDGPRFTEAFGDPTHQYVPQMWNQLRPLGAYIENFRNTGTTATMPGHSAVLTGTWQPIANDGTERPHEPTIFEYYRFATGAPMSDTAVIAQKTKLASLSYSDHPSYGAAFGATEDVGHASDEDVFTQVVTTLQTVQPQLVLVSLSEVDLKGHSGVWQDYLDQLVIADSLCAATWNYLQSDPFYAGQTYMFVTADHGRHDDANGGFRSHGDACEGCQRLIFLALGPRIKTGYTVPATSIYSQRDICPTVASLLDISAPLTDGVVMDEILEPVATGIKD